MLWSFHVYVCFHNFPDCVLMSNCFYGQHSLRTAIPTTSVIFWFSWNRDVFIWVGCYSNSWAIICTVQGFQRLAVYLSISIAPLCPWKLRLMVNKLFTAGTRILKGHKRCKIMQNCANVAVCVWVTHIFAPGWLSVIWWTASVASTRKAVIVPWLWKSIFHPAG